MGRHPFENEKPTCLGCGECCYFREDGGPLSACPHLTEKNKCDQYDDRPPFCKNWWCVESFERKNN